MSILTVNGNTCEYIKLDETVEFFCSRCQKRKVARKYAVYSDAQKAPIRRNGNHHSGRWKSLYSDQIYAA